MESVTEIADKVDAEGKKLDDSFKKQVFWSSLVFAIILVVLCICFCWNYPKFERDDNWWLDAERFGQYGDFFGGVFGSIITFIGFFFLYKAFREQRLANVEMQEINKKLLQQNEYVKQQDFEHLYSERLQRFDSRFATLLALYQKSISDYVAQGDMTGKYYLTDKISEYISSTSFENNDAYIKRCHSAYLKFCGFINKNRELVNVHMRLLYQIFLLLDTDEIKDEDKQAYIKTIRAQLSGKELILIRYNCMGNRGSKMQKPVFQYNICKHLPLLDLFEFKKYRKKLTAQQTNALNEEFILWRKQINSLFLQDSFGLAKTFSKGYGKRYILNIKIDADDKKYEFTLEKKSPTRGRNYTPIIPVLDKFDGCDLECLLLEFHTEIFQMSHFRVYNRENGFGIKHSRHQIENKELISIKVSNSEKIILNYLQVSVPT